MNYTNLNSQILIATSNSKHELGMTFLRFQEYYEGPKYKGQIFTIKEYKEWYKKTYQKNEFTYCSDWSGYNIPDYVIKDVKNNFKRLSKYEREFISECQKMTEPYYVIGSRKSDMRTMRHEISHAFWHIYPSYKREISNCILKILNDTNINKIRENLIKMGYNDCVMEDETQAYLLTDFDTYIKKWGVKIPSASIDPLRKIYNDHIIKYLTVDYNILTSLFL